MAGKHSSIFLINLFIISFMAERKSRSKQASDSRKLSKARARFERYLKWVTGDDFMNLSKPKTDLWIRAFKTFPKTSKEAQYEKFLSWIIDALNEHLEVGRERRSLTEQQKYREDTLKEYQERFDSLPILQGTDFGEFDSMVRDTIKHTDTLVDPDISDKVLLELYNLYVPEDVREELQFTDSAGCGYVFCRESALWCQLDGKQMQTHLYLITSTRLQAAKVFFTSTGAEAYWKKRIGDLSTYNGLFAILKGRRLYPNNIEEKINRQEWLVSLSNKTVFDAKTATTRVRVKEDYFSQEMDITYLDDVADSNDLVINDAKLRAEFLKELSDADVYPHRATAFLHGLFPNVMKMVSETFTDNDRLWFILCRLGVILSGFCIREILFVYGKGKGGKSTLFQSIVDICGNFGIVIQKASFLKNKFETGASHKTDLKRAVNRRICLVDELESSDVMNETLLKNWASHQKIPMREIYGKQGEELLKSYLVFITNEPPRFSQEDSTIRERVRAVRVTTKYFDNDCPRNERPLSYTSRDSWKDGYSDAEDTHWVYRTSEKEAFSRSFRESKERRSELGSFLCLLTTMVYKICKNGRQTQLPIPAVVQEDSRIFFEESDVIETFLDEFYEDEKTYAAACTLRDVYDKFRFKFPELGIRSFTLQTFKRALGGKNLLFPQNRKSAIKIKKKLKNSDANVYLVQ